MTIRKKGTVNDWLDDLKIKALRESYETFIEETVATVIVGGERKDILKLIEEEQRRRKDIATLLAHVEGK